jgi:undecaprenyl-diphosphatase
MYHPFTYPEALVIGLVQGVTELFPISSLGHSVIIPALVGGSWAQDLNVSEAESPYLAFIVGLHVATAAAMILYFWRDWLRIIKGFFGSVAHVVSPAEGTRRFEPQTTEQRLAWMIILATIPVGIAGLLLEHDFRVYFSKPVLASIFLAVNGLILFSGEAVRRRRSGLDSQQSVEDRQMAAVGGAGAPGGARHSSGQRALKQQEATLAVQADKRLAGVGWLSAFGLGASQILALLPGISRDGTVMVCAMFRGLSRQDAARFSFLLSAPVILAAGVLKIPDLTGPLGNGVRGQVIAGSVVSFIAAYLALRFLMRYFAQNRPLTPFAVYCLVAGIGCAIYLGVT